MIFKKRNKLSSSKTIASERLRVLLISDRIDCNPDIMHQITKDITKAISKYLIIDTQSVDVQIKKTLIKDKNKYQARITANAPIRAFNTSNNISK